jgi:membrane-associated phospholipid phosphatase
VLSSVDFYGLLAYLLAPRLRTRLQRALLGLGTLLLVLLIAASRIMLARHYITDVFAGLGFGLFWSALVYTAIDAYLLRRLRSLRQQTRSQQAQA